MADTFTKEKRSDIMSRIRSKDTGIEKLVFGHLRRKKVYFQKHYKRVKGCPDIAIPSKKIAVFIDGDFWHGYKFDEWKDRVPKEYWRNKIESNIARDRRNRAKLKRDGWKVMRIWGHQLSKSPEKTLGKIETFISQTP
ncbi:MAG: very short patch repair endonuclease [Alphaproteobacteria bacterium]|nr:very short patch repair endonuclease [Alphaproteobacteria bacterium]